MKVNEAGLTQHVSQVDSCMLMSHVLLYVTGPPTTTTSAPSEYALSFSTILLLFQTQLLQVADSDR